MQNIYRVPFFWRRRSPGNAWKLLAVVAIAVAVIVMLRCRWEWINGTWNQRWEFHWVPSARIFPPMLLSAAPALLAQRVRSRWAALSMMAVTLLALQLVAVGLPLTPWSLERLVAIVVSPLTTSYYSDAARLHAVVPSTQWLIGHFPEIAQHCAMHAREKPPGQILYYLAWQLMYGRGGLDVAALAGGLGVAVIASAGVFTTFGLARASGVGERAARLAASVFALLPGMVVFCPTFDQVHATFTGLIVGAWLIALRQSGRRRYAAALVCGGATAVASFMAYSPLTLGAICAAAGVLQRVRGDIAWRQLLLAVAMVMLPLLLFYGCLWFWCGFEPLNMFRHAYTNELANEASFPLPHRYPDTLPGDMKGFLDGSGWVCLPLMLCGLVRARKSKGGALVWLAAGQIVVVWLSGLLKCETMRIWLFLQPLAMLPVAVELATWPAWQRTAFLAILAVVTTAIAQNLLFMGTM